MTHALTHAMTRWTACASTRPRAWRAGLALLLGLLATPLASPFASAAEFTPAQRAEIIAIIREALKTDPSLLRDAVEALQAEEGRAQAEATRAALTNAKAELYDATGPVGGNPKGDVTIVEFFDVRCGYCRRMHPVMADLLRADPNIRVIYKDLPILGPASALGAKALLAAHAQDGYVRMYNALLTLGPEPTMDWIRAEAHRQGLDPERLARDMESAEVLGRIRANLALAQRLNIRGTPGFVIGDTLIPGAVGRDELAQAVAAARAAAR